MNIIAKSLTAVALAGLLGFGSIAPASADQAAATRNEIFGAAALIAGIATAINVSHKDQVANTVLGDTADGATVYGDDRVVEPNGQSWYPNDHGRSLSCNNGQCWIGRG